MFSNRLAFLLLIPVLFLQACSEIPVAPRISIREQLEVDTMKASGLVSEFRKQAVFDSKPSVEKYLQSVALQIISAEEELRGEKVTARIHVDLNKEWKSAFAFPGVMISVPRTFLGKVNFENELAALISYQLALIRNRELARALEKDASRPLTGDRGVFRFSVDAILASIEAGTRMMYAAGYDPRGMVSLIEKHPGFFVDESSTDIIKEKERFIKQAQKIKNEFLPSLQPIVRSNDFLQMKKELKGSS
jgi:hypothetical protein